MLFAKDDRKNTLASSSVTGPSSSKTIPKQYAFGNEDDLDVEKSFGGITRGGPTLSAPSAAALLQGAKSPDKKQKSRRPTPPPTLPPVRPKFIEQPPQMPKAPAGQVVLDKFGNFRLASTDKPPEPPAPPRGRGATGGGSRSRSRSRRRYSSDSRSRSRSMKRRSRSRSYGRRRGSRSRSFRSRTGSRSRSYSRSRSRSGSIDRRRDRRMRGNRGGYDRGTYYKPRFGNARGPRGGRGGGGGGFRDYNRDFRNNRGRDRYRGGWGNNRGGGSRYRNYRDDSRERRFDRRSRSRSFNSGDDRKRSPNDDRKRSPIDDRKRSPNDDRKFSDNEPERNNIKRDARRSPPPPVSANENWDTADQQPQPNISAKIGNANVGSNDASLEEIEKIIDKAKKENKEDMIERNKDLVKKTTTW